MSVVIRQDSIAPEAAHSAVKAAVDAAGQTGTAVVCGCGGRGR